MENQPIDEPDIIGESSDPSNVGTSTESIGGTGTESTGSIGTGTGPKWGSARNAGQSVLRNNRQYPASNTEEEETRDAIRSQSRAEVEPPIDKPRRVHRSKEEIAAKSVKTTKTAGSFTADECGKLICLFFGLTAQITQREWWAIENPDLEVNPFAPNVANLANKYLPEWGDKLKDGTDATAVAMGIFALVLVRSRKDQYYRQQVLQARRKEMLERQEDIEQQTVQNQPTTPNGKSPLISRPSEPIFGDNTGF